MSSDFSIGMSPFGPSPSYNFGGSGGGGGLGGLDATSMWSTLGGLPMPSNDSLTAGPLANAQMFAALQQYAPAAINSINAQAPATAQSQLAAQQAVQSGYNQLGAENVANADKYQRQLDPEFYKQTGAISDALTKYLGSYSPTELTPTELAQISRGINATTGPVTPSNLNTIKNAQVFGEAGTNRWKNFGDAVTRAASVLPTLRSGISGFQVANTGAGSTAANAASNNALNANFGFSTSALGDIAGNTQAQIQKSKDYWDKLKAGSPSSLLGGII